LQSPSAVSADAVVLVVDNDPAMGEVLDAALSASGYIVHLATTAEVGLQLASAMEPDVVIVDLGLPDLDGVEMCRRLRRWTSIPLLVLTADATEGRKVEALDSGADDFVSKPFSMPELLARVRVAVRHRRALAHVAESSLLELGRLRIDTAAHEATVDGKPLVLTRKEFVLLAMLARNEGRVILHRVLLSGVWGGERARVELLRSHVTQLRRKLSEAGLTTTQIVNEPGVGYRIVMDHGR
jgi:two-component system KDP operon response regulator KdpE